LSTCYSELGQEKFTGAPSEHLHSLLKSIVHAEQVLHENKDSSSNDLIQTTTGKPAKKRVTWSTSCLSTCTPVPSETIDLQNTEQFQLLIKVQSVIDAGLALAGAADSAGSCSSLDTTVLLCAGLQRIIDAGTDVTMATAAAFLLNEMHSLTRKPNQTRIENEDKNANSSAIMLVKLPYSSMFWTMLSSLTRYALRASTFAVSTSLLPLSTQFS
jgi:hypothetical protein